MWKNIVKKHGYKVEIVFETVNENEAFLKEIENISKFKPRANLTQGGQGTSGFKHDPKFVAFRNKRNKKLNATPEGHLKKSLAQKETQNRPEVKERVSKGLKNYYKKLKDKGIAHHRLGFVVSKETKEKISNSQSGNKGYWYGKTTSVAKKVININTQEIFKSVKEAAKSVNGSCAALIRALKQRKGLFKKQTFKYLED